MKALAVLCGERLACEAKVEKVLGSARRRAGSVEVRKWAMSVQRRHARGEVEDLKERGCFDDDDDGDAEDIKFGQK